MNVAAPPTAHVPLRRSPVPTATPFAYGKSVNENVYGGGLEGIGTATAKTLVVIGNGPGLEKNAEG